MKERRHFVLSFSRSFSPEESHQRRVNPAPFSRYAHSCDKASKANRRDRLVPTPLALVALVRVSLSLSLSIYCERGRREVNAWGMPVARDEYGVYSGNPTCCACRIARVRIVMGKERRGLYGCSSDEIKSPSLSQVFWADEKRTRQPPARDRSGNGRCVGREGSRSTDDRFKVRELGNSEKSEGSIDSFARSSELIGRGKPGLTTARIG